MSPTQEFFLEFGCETGDKDGMTNGCWTAEVNSRKAMFDFVCVCLFDEGM